MSGAAVERPVIMPCIRILLCANYVSPKWGLHLIFRLTRHFYDALSLCENEENIKRVSSGCFYIACTLDIRFRPFNVTMGLEYLGGEERLRS